MSEHPSQKGGKRPASRSKGSSTKSSADEHAITGKYSNYFKVGHNAFEIVIDFGQYYTGEPKPQIHTRIITTPPFGLAFLTILKKTLREFEREVGPIAKLKPEAAE